MAGSQPKNLILSRKPEYELPGRSVLTAFNRFRLLNKFLTATTPYYQPHDCSKGDIFGSYLPHYPFRFDLGCARGCMARSLERSSHRDRLGVGNLLRQRCAELLELWRYDLDQSDRQLRFDFYSVPRWVCNQAGRFQGCGVARGRIGHMGSGFNCGGNAWRTLGNPGVALRKGLPAGGHHILYRCGGHVLHYSPQTARS